MTHLKIQTHIKWEDDDLTNDILNMKIEMPKPEPLSTRVADLSLDDEDLMV